MRGFLVGSLLVAALSTATQVHAKMIDVRMKNNGQGGFMVFEPALIQADVGDTVRFLPVDAGHNAEPINGFLPAGVATTGGQVGKEYQLKLTKPGFYGIKCRPHFALGMVALIKAGRGTAPNEAAIASAISSLPPMAKKRMIALRSIAH